MKRQIRIMDVINFLWATFHDVVYIGIAAAVYWLYHQPPQVRNNALIIGAIVAVWLFGEVINFRWHRQMDRRLRRLERKLRKSGDDD